MIDPDKMFAHSAQLIATVAENPMQFASGMVQWFDYCERVAPESSAIWRRLRKIDFERDADKLTNWLTRLLKKEPPPANINGLWFGLYNPVLRNGGPSCQMYVGGSTGFDPGSTSNEWVCQLSWLPKGRYSSSSVLAELYRSVEAVADGVCSYLGEPFLCHGYLALLVSQWCHGPLSEILRGNAEVRAVVIGHDSGDFYRMAVLCANETET